MSFGHRGRFQAQGKNLEESEGWAQDNPLTIIDGRKKLNDLKNKIPPNELLAREVAFIDCRKFIDKSNQSGGINIGNIGKVFRKSFPNNFIERVDLEVHKGIAFVD